MEWLAYRSPLEAYEAEAHALWTQLQAGDDAARWRFKWEHPRFRGKGMDEVKPSTLTLDDARLVVARAYAFETWRDLEAFTRAVAENPDVERFESAAEAVTSGDIDHLRAQLRESPTLARARSARRHHGTLLHYVAANGVEGARQRTPANAVEIAKLLLEQGAEPDALADMYGGQCTPLSMLVSSAHPAAAKLQAPLAELLLDYGANPRGAGSRTQSPVLIALAFGYSDTAEALARRAPPEDDLAIMAGLGRLADTARLLPKAGIQDKRKALALAAQHGKTDVLKLLLEAGLDPNRYNPDGFHAHSTPLHQAVWSNHADTVRFLVERGARLDLRDSVHDATPLDWAVHGGHAEIAEYLRQAGAK